VIGDLWFNPSTATWGYWNGTYWLTLPQALLSSSFSLTITTSNTGLIYLPVDVRGVAPGTSRSVSDFIHDWSLVIRLDTADASNYWTAQPKRYNANGAGTNLGSPITIDIPYASAYYNIPMLSNTLLPAGANAYLGLDMTKVLTPGSLIFNSYVIFSRLL